MVHEKIIKDTRGTIRIEVELFVSRYFIIDKENKKHFRWGVRVWHKAPSKRSDVINTQIATAEEILAAKMEAYELIKPN